MTPFLETSSLAEPQGLLHRPPFNDTLRAHQNPTHLVWMDRSTLSLGSPQHFTQGPLERPEPQVLELSLLGSSLTSPRNSCPKPFPPERSQLCWVWGLKLRAPECGSWRRSIRINRELAEDSFHGLTWNLQIHNLSEWGSDLMGLYTLNWFRKNLWPSGFPPVSHQGHVTSGKW